MENSTLKSTLIEFEQRIRKETKEDIANFVEKMAKLAATSIEREHLFSLATTIRTFKIPQLYSSPSSPNPVMSP